MPLTDFLIGRQLGDYRIEDLLGRGGMAHVYRGYDPKLERYAAVKVINAQLLAQETEDEYRLRFQREARAIAHLHHPNIVGVYQFGEVDALYYMAMVFIEGRDLGQILKEHAANGTLMPPKQVLQIIDDIANALDYAHANGVIHRDIKPSNIMVTPENRAILTDFGLALTTPEGTMGNTFGSAYYIAPEQAISSANAVPQSDLYALGVVLYQMLTGRVPFDDPSAMSVALKHLSDPPPPPRQVNAALPPEVEEVVLQALEKEPSKRYANGETLAQALDEAFRQTGYDARAVRSPEKGDQPQMMPILQDSFLQMSRVRLRQALDTDARRRAVLVGAVLILLLFGGTFGILSLINGEDDAPPPTAASVAVVITDEATAAPAAPTDSPTDKPTVVAMVEPTSTSEPSATVELSATATLTATAEPTQAPTATDAPTLTPTDLPPPTAITSDDASLVLLYDSDMLALINRAERAMSIRYISFQQGEGFNAIRFRADQWQSPILSAIPPGTCFLIWRNNLREPESPPYCPTYEAWFAAGTASRFWINPDDTATFSVYNAGELVATCAIGAGECAISAP